VHVNKMLSVLEDRSPWVRCRGLLLKLFAAAAAATAAALFSPFHSRGSRRRRVHCIPGGFSFSEADVVDCISSDFMFNDHLGGDRFL